MVTGRCLACGECRKACPFGKTLSGTGPLPLRLEPCTLCGACVEACPTEARQMAGRTLSVAEVMHELLQDRIFYEDSGGGVTFSGGEPLMQPRFLLALLEACRDASLPTALDTTGFSPTEPLLAAASLARLVLYDLKVWDDARHQQLTGVSNRIILDNLRQLDRLDREIWIRLPIVPGVNDDAENIRQIAEFVSSLRRVALVSVLPYHRTARHKYERLGLAHRLEDFEAPSAATLERAAQTFRAIGLPVRVGG